MFAIDNGSFAVALVKNQVTLVQGTYLTFTVLRTI